MRYCHKFKNKKEEESAARELCYKARRSTVDHLSSDGAYYKESALLRLYALELDLEDGAALFRNLRDGAKDMDAFLTKLGLDPTYADAIEEINYINKEISERLPSLFEAGQDAGRGQAEIESGD